MDIHNLENIIPAIVIITISVVVFAKIARGGGWGALAKKYPAKTKPEGDKFRGQSAEFSTFVRYRNCLTVILCEQGIYVTLAIIVPIGKSFMVPWTSVKRAQVEKYAFVKSCVLTIEDQACKFYLVMNLKAESAIAKYHKVSHSDFDE